MRKSTSAALAGTERHANLTTKGDDMEYAMVLCKTCKKHTPHFDYKEKRCCVICLTPNDVSRKRIIQMQDEACTGRGEP